MQHHCDQLIDIFQQSLGERYNTRLVKGGEEPEYLPADSGCSYHRIVFTKDYFASALHELAHWCIAGQSRRLLVDYGYWYAPDGRSLEQQHQFEQVEVKPQALEWLFSVATHTRFRVSADNLNAHQGASDTFCQAIVAQAQHYCQARGNERATQLISALSAYYQVHTVYDPMLYTLDKLI